jgi:hypothetical protein
VAYSLDHLIAVEVLAEPPLAIASVVGYRDELEWQFSADGKPLFDTAGNPVTKSVKVVETVDVEKGATAYLDPELTNIAVLVQAKLVKLLPKAEAAPVKKAAKD